MIFSENLWTQTRLGKVLSRHAQWFFSYSYTIIVLTKISWIYFANLLKWHEQLTYILIMAVSCPTYRSYIGIWKRLNLNHFTTFSFKCFSLTAKRIFNLEIPSITYLLNTYPVDIFVISHFWHLQCSFIHISKSVCVWVTVTHDSFIRDSLLNYLLNDLVFFI